jgi:Tfp pilus assembly protein PilZ
MFRTLRVEFDSLETFQAEYQRNIANGGVFASTSDDFELREVVEVELALTFCDRIVPLQGEVVRKWPHLAATAEPGVAIQFLEAIDGVRALFAELVGIAPAARDPEEAAWLERFGPTRRHERTTVVVPCQIISSTGVQSGTTKNLSRSGVLITLDSSPPPPVGEATTFEIAMPRTGEMRRIATRVVRNTAHLADQCVVALAFELEPGEEESTAKFIQEIGYSYGTSASDAITGPVQTIGVANLVQTFSSCTQCGTLTVYPADDQVIASAAHVVFENGGLRHAVSRPATGMKAFARVLAIKHGRFEFKPRIPEDLPPTDPVPIYGALLEAVQYVDELARINRAGLPPTARLRRTATAASFDLSKLHHEVLDAADRGETIRSTVDQITAYDAEVYRALLELMDERAVTLDTSPT